MLTLTLQGDTGQQRGGSVISEVFSNRNNPMVLWLCAEVLCSHLDSSLAKGILQHSARNCTCPGKEHGSR